MQSNYKIIILISFFLLLLSVGSSTSYYIITMEGTEKQLKNQALPLSVDNIYTSIQKHIIEPSLVASMMANDTFVKEWLKNKETDSVQIQRYLDSVKNKYGMFMTFLASEKTLKYYTQNSIIEDIKPNNPIDNWYYEFKNIEKNYEINLDKHINLSKNLIMFINHKILDDKFQYLGATGVGIKVSYISDLLQNFKDKYMLKVNFVDKMGNILFINSSDKKEKTNINTMQGLNLFKDKILSKQMHTIEYTKYSSKYIASTKYIEELDLYLLVEAKLDDFTTHTKNIFYISLSISLILAFFIAFILIYIIKKHNQQSEYFAHYDTLTEMPNRRNFAMQFEKIFALSKRIDKPLSLLFLDIDNFKSINDNFGHNVGDEVLIEIAKIIKTNLRETDIYARWGGEEFIIIFVGSSAQEALAISNKIRKAIEDNLKLHHFVGHSVTISAGLTNINITDTQDSAISRADKAMYIAKNNGKNRIEMI